jgi:hypothetical protein
MSRPENENPRDRLEKTARELRKHRPRPSEALVARIERLAERAVARRPHSTRVWLGRRRLVFALAAALAIATVGAIVHSELQPSSQPTALEAAHSVTKNSTLKKQGFLPASTTRAHGVIKSSQNSSRPPSSSSGRPSTDSAVSQYALPNVRQPRARVIHSADLAGSTATSTTPRAGLAPFTTAKRLAELRAILTLKVEDRAQLSSATAKAMRIVSSLGGYIASARYQTPSRGVATSTLTLKVPATHAQDALTRISALGVILSQNVSLKDLQRPVTVEADRIKTLQGKIADLERSLSDSSLTSQTRSQLQVQLANARVNLHSLQAQRSAKIRRGRLATITLTLTTGGVPKTPSHPSRIHKAIDRAWNGLSSEISWATMALIVASPFLLLVAALAVLVRYRRRREERRLLEQ